MKLLKTGLRRIWSKNDQYFLESWSKVNFIKLAEVRPTLEFSKICKPKCKCSLKDVESKFGGLTGDPTGGNFGNHSEAVSRAARGG